MFWQVPFISVTVMCRGQVILIWSGRNGKVRVRGGHYARYYGFSVGAQVALDLERQSADHFDPFSDLWVVLTRSSSVRNLKIIFQSQQQNIDQQV